MASELQFKINGRLLGSVPVKLDRRKLYGSTEIVATDESGALCQAASLDADGALIVPAGGSKVGLIAEDGKWIERSDLIPVNKNGERLEVLPSSFESPIELVSEATVEGFLDHNWKSVYLLENAELAGEIGDKIYSFSFNYRSDVNPNEGFLVASDGKAFLFAGERQTFDYVGIAEQTVLDAEEEESSEDDELDFSMM